MAKRICTYTDQCKYSHLYKHIFLNLKQWDAKHYAANFYRNMSISLTPIKVRVIYFY
jgi:hypothetical protein